MIEQPGDEFGAFRARLAFETVKQPGRFNVDAFGHRANVYPAGAGMIEVMTTPLLQGLPPIIDERARVLILGNMPSVMSLAAQQYYANPRNAFWRITGDILGFGADEPYEARTAALRGRGVAVWDVLRSCRRVGSLDLAVEPESMEPNDFRHLFATHPAIERVVFNGAAAEKNFARLVVLEQPVPQLRLPSTSPAQTMRYEDKLRAWRAGLEIAMDIETN
jgi:hypoxanthine-DNA glycosylase